MMHKLIPLTALALCFGAQTAGAQSVLDGSDKSLKPEIVQAAITTVTVDFLDPKAAQFRNLFEGKGETICGEVNGKNGFGGYVGFKPFRFDAKNNSFSIYEIDPELIEMASLKYLVFKYSGCADRLRMVDPAER